MNKQDEAAARSAGSSPETAAPQTLDPWFLELLACPGCEAHPALKLDVDQNTLNCACGRYAFPIRDGIPILLIDEATVLNPDAGPAALPAN
jgi:uncharacterized protein YbaR (Trm112 family)